MAYELLPPNSQFPTVSRHYICLHCHISNPHLWLEHPSPLVCACGYSIAVCACVHFSVCACVQACIFCSSVHTSPSCYSDSWSIGWILQWASDWAPFSLWIVPSSLLALSLTLPSSLALTVGHGTWYRLRAFSPIFLCVWLLSIFLLFGLSGASTCHLRPMILGSNQHWANPLVVILGVELLPE
jgi:hypothetical protein